MFFFFVSACFISIKRTYIYTHTYVHACTHAAYDARMHAYIRYVHNLDSNYKLFIITLLI